jgi:hypothetical protein
VSPINFERSHDEGKLPVKEQPVATPETA